MDGGKGLSRRNFIKAAGVAGGAMMLAAGVSIPEGLAAPASGDAGVAAADAPLRGVSDIHIHAAPDSRGRSVNELGLSRQAKAAGYRSVMFKSNDFSCHDRAYLVREALPDFDCFGSLCMNRVHGDRVNVRAAEAALRTTGGFCRCIWLPTQDAAYQVKMHNLPGPGIPVLNSSGQALPEVVRVMELCAEADIILASGHSSPKETLVLARQAREVGVKKFVVTHANSLIWKMTHDQIRQAADLGAWVEFCYLNCLWGPGTGLPEMERQSVREFIDFVSVVPERSFISTDLGQVGLPNPLDGMKACVTALRDGGVMQADLDRLLRSTPAWLVGLA